MYLPFEGAIIGEKLEELLQDLCDHVGVAAVDVLRYRRVSTKGIDVSFFELEDDKDHFYMNFEFGAVAAGRTLAAYRLMLESNILVYAHESGVLGVDSETGNAVLSLRSRYSSDVDAEWLSSTLTYFADHAKYWQTNILECSDEMLRNITSGKYQWLKA